MSHIGTTYRHDMRGAARLVRSDYLPQYSARSYAISAKGTQAQINQDSYLVADHFPATGRHLPGSRKHMPSLHDPGDALYVIADGEGEAHAGSRASGRAVETIEESLRLAWAAFDQPANLARDRHVLGSLRSAFDRAEHIVRTESIPESRGGVALTAIAVQGSKLYLGHVGETRAYIWRAGKLHHLTAIANSSVHVSQMDLRVSDGGGFHEESIGESRRPEWQIKLRVVDIESNDYVLLCTKGLFRHVREHVIRSTISATPDPQRICDSLFAEAGRFPVPEDLTIVVVRFALTHG